MTDTADRLLASAARMAVAPETEMDPVQQEELIQLATGTATYRFGTVLADSSTAARLRAPMLAWAIANGNAVTEANRPLPAEQAAAAAVDPVEGWGPDWGLWYFNFERDIVNGLGDRIGAEYEYSSTFSWDSYDQIRKLRLGGDASGFEMNLAYKDYPNQPTRSGDTSHAGGWSSNMPGSYRETLTVDDSLTTYAIGSHEAEKIRWRLEDNPSFSQSYWVTHFVQDVYKYELQGANQPAHTVYAQYDDNMLCGGAAADSCFFETDSKNLWNNYFCKYHFPQNPVDIRVWDFRGSSPTYSGPCY